MTYTNLNETNAGKYHNLECEFSDDGENWHTNGKLTGFYNDVSRLFYFQSNNWHSYKHCRYKEPEKEEKSCDNCEYQPKDKDDYCIDCWEGERWQKKKQPTYYTNKELEELGAYQVKRPDNIFREYDPLDYIEYTEDNFLWRGIGTGDPLKWRSFRK